MLYPQEQDKIASTSTARMSPRASGGVPRNVAVTRTTLPAPPMLKTESRQLSDLSVETEEEESSSSSTGSDGLTRIGKNSKIIATRITPLPVKKNKKSASSIRSRLLTSLGVARGAEAAAAAAACAASSPTSSALTRKKAPCCADNMSKIAPSAPPSSIVHVESHHQRRRVPALREDLKGDYGQPDDRQSSQEPVQPLIVAVRSLDVAPPPPPPQEAQCPVSPSSYETNTTTSSSLSASAPLSSSLISSTSSSSSSPDKQEEKEHQQRHRNRGVSFDREVIVHPIPSFRAYSDRIRCHLWSSPSEMQENAARNCYEYACEGWDWHNVVEDEMMINYEGEKIHPSHFQGGASADYSLNSQLMTVVSSQQRSNNGSAARCP